MGTTQGQSISPNSKKNKKNAQIMNKGKRELWIDASKVIFIALCCLAIYNGRPSWLGFEFGEYFSLFILTSLLGSIVVFDFSSLIYTKEIKLITYLSRNTMTILGVHLSLFSFIPTCNPFIGAAIVLYYCVYRKQSKIGY